MLILLRNFNRIKSLIYIERISLEYNSVGKTEAGNKSGNSIYNIHS